MKTKIAIKHILILLAMLCSLSMAMAQDDQESADNETDSIYAGPSIAVQRKVESNKVIIRWAPTNYSLFRHAAENGYILQRRAYSANPEIEFTPETDIDKGFKTVKTVMPWTNEEWQQNATDSTDIYAGVAMQILLGGEIQESKKGEMDAINNYYEDQLRKFSYGLIAADLSRTAALGLGLRYEDEDVQPGYYYEYRIMFKDLPEGFEPDTAWCWADTKRPTEAKKVDHCFLEANDHAMTVFWTRHNDQFFTAYDVERSTDQVNWTKLNSRPWMTSLFTPETPNFFIDSLESNEQTYYYRIKGYTAFAEQGEYSDVMSDKGVDLTAPAPAWGIKAEDMGGYVAIEWEAQPVEPDFDGFYVERSDMPNGHFERISDKLPSDARQFADLMPDHLVSNYYRIVSVDVDGNEAVSFSDLGYVVDSMPPSMPTGLTGSIDTNGIVDVEWTPGPEEDLIGYRIYWSNNKDLEFTQLVGDVIPGINFRDSINIKTLNEEIYYKVVAVDHRYNHSEYSEVLTIKKPDIVPPAEALIHRYEVDDKGITIAWYTSTSKDVTKQELMRRKGNGEWENVGGSMSLTDTSYIDQNVEKGTTYEYKVVVTDDANLTSTSNVLTATFADKGLNETEVKTNLNVTGNNAQLSWTSNANSAKYVLFKQRNGEQTKLGSIFAPEANWTDNDFKQGDTYTMRVMYPDGSESKLIQF